MDFKKWLLIKENIEKMEIDSHEILVFQYSPDIQFHSGLGDIDKKYFLDVFGNSKPSSSKIEEFCHSYVKNDPSGERLGARIVAYIDGRIVIGKAMNHVYLQYHPNKKGINVEGYFDPKNKTITISHSYSDLFNNLEVWKKIINNLNRADLIGDDWKIKGCPPNCEDEPYLLAKDILSQKTKIQNNDSPSIKEKETQDLVRNFMAQRAIQNKSKDLMGYMYRYGESINENTDVKKTLKKIPKKHFELIKKYKIHFEPNNTLKGDAKHIGFIDEKNKKIKIAAPWNYSREFTLLHEVAHAVWKYMLDRNDKKEWKKIVKNTKNKQNQNDEELFCMAYANYYAKHKVEIHNHETWNEFIKNINK